VQTSKGGKPLKAKKATPSVDFDLAGTSTKVNVHNVTPWSVRISSFAKTAQPVPDLRETARRTLNMYFRYSWPLLDHFSSTTPMNIIKADVHTCMLEIIAIHFDNTNVSQKLESNNEPFLADFKRGKTPQSQKGNTQRGFRPCWNFNKGKCSYGQKV
jgi:hypothetical protein